MRTAGPAKFATGSRADLPGAEPSRSARASRARSWMDARMPPAGARPRRSRVAGDGPGGWCREGGRAQFAGGRRHVHRVRAPAARRGVPPRVPGSSSRAGRDRVAEEFEPEVGIPRPGPGRRTARACSSSSARLSPYGFSPCRKSDTVRLSVDAEPGVAGASRGSPEACRLKEPRLAPAARSSPAGAVPRAGWPGKSRPARTRPRRAGR